MVCEWKFELAARTLNGSRHNRAEMIILFASEFQWRVLKGKRLMPL